MEKIRKAYDEIFKCLNKHKDICIFDIQKLKREADIHLFGIQLKKVYGLNIDEKQVDSLDWLKFGEYKRIAWYGPKYNRDISWSVDGRQPKDELLFFVSFSTGAYIFGNDYPTDFFQKFWLELKELKPDYIDEANHYLFWEIENAEIPFNQFDEIYKKYRILNQDDFKKRQIQKMKKELEALEKQ